MPTISVDFLFPHAEGSGKEHPNTDRSISQVVAFTCLGKSTKGKEYSEEIVHKCKMFGEMLVYERVATKSDQETAARALQQRVQKAVNVEMVPNNSKRYDCKSNSKVEKAIQEVKRHTRTLKLHIEDRIGETIPPDDLVIHWMVEYAADVIHRFRAINGKMTPRETIRGKHAMQRIV